MKRRIELEKNGSWNNCREGFSRVSDRLQEAKTSVSKTTALEKALHVERTRKTDKILLETKKFN